MEIMKSKKRVLSFFLAFFLMLTAILPVQISAATSHEDFMRVFHLDCGRKYFTVAQITEIIDALAASGYTHMELAIGNGGLRLLLDDMSVTAGSTTYAHDKVVNGIKAGNVSFAHAGEWTQSEMDSIISYAASKNISIIPLVNSPGHMSAILDAAEYAGISSPAYSAKVSSGWWGSTSTKTSTTTVSLSNSAAVAFTQALVKKYVDYFADRGSEYFNIGADEYAADVHSSGSMGFGYMQSKGWYDDYVKYINDVAAIIKNAGMKPIAFNDGIYFNQNDDTAFDKDIIIAYWIPSWGTYYVASPAYLVSKGHKILNTNDDWYYVIGRTSEGYGYDNAYNGVNNTPVTKVADGSTMALSNLAGSMNCVWCDEPNANYESNKSNVMYFIARLAEKNPDYFVVNTHEHTYETITVDATCTEDGSVITYCTGCGEQTTEVIKAFGHKYECVKTDATCTEDGAFTYTCTHCGDIYSENIEAAGHSYSCTITDATCTEEGARVYTCSVCEDTYTEAIEPLGHKYTGVVTEATCLKDGFTTYTCTGCGDSYTADYTEAKGHTYTAVTVEATCTEDGSVTYYCACGDLYTEVIPTAGHSYQTVVTAPTCIAEGYTTHICTSCGDSYVSEHTAALGHTCDTIVVDPTCTTAGYTSSTCTVCGEVSIYDETAALGHDYVSETVDPTETEDGYTIHTCTVCGYSYTDNYVDALGHTLVSVVTEPTCTEDGYTTHTCTTCGEVTVDTYVPALGHNYKISTEEATCTVDGSVSGTCTTCGDTYYEVISAYGHDYELTVTEPTCTEGGHTVYACDRCGDNYVDDYTEALGHKYTTITVDVTCTEDGYTTYLCTNCGDSYTGETVAATGHTYETVIAEATCTKDGSITYTCIDCGNSYAEVIPATGHEYQAEVTEPTCTEDGCTTYTCACGQSYTDEITEALGHDYFTEEVNGNLVYICARCSDTYTESTGWIALTGKYVLDTDGIETGAENKYIVVGSDKNYALTVSNGSIGASSVTVSNNTIVLDDASKYEFYFENNSSKENGSWLLTQDGTNGVYHMGGNIYYGRDNKGYWHFGSASNGAYQLYDYDNLNWYLNYGYVWANDSVSRYAVSSNARSVRLFKAADSYVRLSGALNQTWPHGSQVTESAVLEQVLLQSSVDGITVDSSFAVNGSMVTWNRNFDGYTAGTYIATVQYDGMEIGTVTITVIGEHVYESETVEATCTAQGYTIYTCTDCGIGYTDNYTNPLGHSYSSVESDGYMIYTCEHCGDSYSEKIASTYNKVTTFSSGSNYVITLVSGNKYYAVSHANNRITAVQVTVSNGQITSDISEDLIWTYSGNKLSYRNGNTTYYLYAQSSNNWWNNWWGGSSATLSLSTSNSSNVSLSNSQVKVGSYYLRYTNNSISINNSGTTANLFVEE